MTTFKEIGQYLDKLQLEKKFNLMGKIVEDLVYPKIKVNTESEPYWMTYVPKEPKRKCLQLTKENIDFVTDYFIDMGYKVEQHTDGIYIKYNASSHYAYYGNWIGLIDDQVRVFTDDFFKDNFDLKDFNW